MSYPQRIKIRKFYTFFELALAYYSLIVLESSYYILLIAEKTVFALLCFYVLYCLAQKVFPRKKWSVNC